MNELVTELNAVMDSSFERIARQTKWKLYFERLKANNVKEVFRVDFRTNTIFYFCGSHETSVGSIMLQRATDEIHFETVADILEYMYGG